MKREDFVKVAEDALDSLPEEFRSRIHNVATLVEDFPPNQSPPRPALDKTRSPKLAQSIRVAILKGFSPLPVTLSPLSTTMSLNWALST